MKPTLTNLYTDFLAFLKLDARYKNSFVKYMDEADIMGKSSSLFNFPCVFIKIILEGGINSIGLGATTYEKCNMQVLYIGNNANPDTNFLPAQQAGIDLSAYLELFFFKTEYESIAAKPSILDFITDTNNNNFFSVTIDCVFYWKLFKNFNRIPIPTFVETNITSNTNNV